MFTPPVPLQQETTANNTQNHAHTEEHQLYCEHRLLD